MIIILDYPERRASETDPISGAYTHEIHSLFEETGLAPEDIEFFCVFDNQLEEHFTRSNKETFDPETLTLSDFENSAWPRYDAGWVKPQYVPRLHNLCKTIKERKPNVVVAMGKIAFWAVTSGARLTDHRGTPYFSETVETKVVGTSGLSAFTKDWSLRPIVIADINKAIAHSKFPGFKPKERNVYKVTDPLRDLPHLRNLLKEELVAVDVETEACQITCISISPSETESYVIPFWNKDNLNYHQFKEEEELLLWKFLFELMSNVNVNKVFHNATYDVSYFRHHGIPTLGVIEDTMLMHHSLSPEMQKSLGFLGSLYCDVSAWKTLNKKTKKSINKKDE